MSNPDRTATAPDPRQDGYAPARIPMDPGTPLIGRDRDIETILALLSDPDVALVTITGSGGVGKTRVALAVAHAAARDGLAEVRVVPLADLASADLVIPTIAAAYAIRELGHVPAIDRLIAHLQARTTLLVLDNLEHLLPSVMDLAALLAACPGLTMLITSRVVLNVSGEYEVPLDVLPQPSAVHLFVDRARAADASFALTATNAPLVATICDRLDCLPLAIELAAARIPVLNPAALLARLERPLPLLTGGPHDQPDRLRTLRNAIAWSYDLLDEPDRVMFRRFSVFSGGFRLESVRAICNLLSAHKNLDHPSGDPETQIARLLADPVALPDRIASLIDKSLLRLTPARTDDDQPRYRMLDTIRAFGSELLDASAEGPLVRSSHATAFLALAEQISKRIADTDYDDALVLMDAELDNIRAAFTWSWGESDPGLALRLAEAMARYAAVRGHYREGRLWLERSLGIDGGSFTIERASALRAAGWLARLQGDTSAAMTMQTEAIAIARSLGDDSGLAAALQELALVRMHRGEYAAAIPLMEEALTIYRRLEHASARGAEAVSVCCANLAQVALAAGRPDFAAPFAEEALDRQRALGYGWALGDTLRIAGDIASVLGEHDRAIACYRESVDLTRDHGDLRFLTNALAGLATEWTNAGDWERAVRLFARVTTLRSQIGAGIERWQVERFDQSVAQARTALSEPAFAAAWEEGATADLAAIVEDARGSELARSDGQHAPSPGLADLSRRETGILRLLASGLSDRQIADELSISPRTVSGHVSNILAKLGVNSRTAAAAIVLIHADDPPPLNDHTPPGHSADC